MPKVSKLSRLSSIKQNQRSAGFVLPDSAITTEQISDNSITTDKILDDSIIASKILDGTINSDKLGANVVTLTKLATTVANSLIPPGTILAYSGSTAPSGFLICDGSLPLRVDYPDLFNNIGVAWGIGDGSTTFHLPDMRGRFARGIDGAAGIDSDFSTRTALVASTHNITGNTTISTSTITGLSAAHFANTAIGMSVTGTGIPVNSIIIARTAPDTIQIGLKTTLAAQNATATNAGVTLALSRSATVHGIGSYQLSQFQLHGHPWRHANETDVINDAGGGAILTDLNGAQAIRSAYTGTPGNDEAQSIGGSGSGTQTHPINVYVNYIIKY